MLTVTTTAKEKFKEYLTQEGKPDAFIRIYVSGVGWGGPRYGLTLEESFQEEKDLTEDLGDVKVIYDQGISSFVDGKTVDFHDGPQAGFSITDPGSADKCDGGCC